MPLSNPLALSDLEAYLVDRNIAAGFALLERWAETDAPLNPAHPETVAFLFLLAQWVDLGFRDWEFFDRAGPHLAEIDPLSLPVLAFLQLRAIQAMRLIALQSVPEAIALLDTILRSGADIMPPFMVFVANFIRGRAHRLEGSFDAAVVHIHAARDTARTMNAPKLEAVTKIHESWLVFHKGERRQALLLLDEAENELLTTGHALSLGNIAAARGRFIRSTGDYASALEHFQAAIELYTPHYAWHTSHARALVNAAYVKRLIALELQPRMRGGPGKAATHALMLQIAQEAMDLLRSAAAIYARLQHQAGTGSVLVNLGYLQLESGDIESAAREAAEAYALGEGKQDLTLMARARILQASVELAFSDEQLEEHTAIGAHAKLALQYTEQAVGLARQTQNKRLLAGAYIVRGHVAADSFFLDWDAAREYAAMSAQLLLNGEKDHLYQELSGLKQKIARSTAVDEMLRLWSSGELGGKSFQTVQEEFAELVIPKVWQKAGRNVAQVAQELRISPKKVRRILRSARLIAGG